MNIKRAFLILMAAMLLPGLAIAQTGDNLGQFVVEIDFLDGNPMAVTADITCNTGSPLDQTAEVSEDIPLEGPTAFAVENMIAATPAMCEITIEGLDIIGYTAVYNPFNPAGGSVSSTSCLFEYGTNMVFIGDDVQDAINRCRVTLEPEQAEVEITKEWEVDGNIDLTLEFDAEITVRSNVYFTNANSYYCGPGPSCYKRKVTFDKGPGSESKSLYFDVGYLGGWVTLDEEVFDSAFESEDDCGGRLSVSPGSYGECTFTNTAFFEGIPTLSQYGMAIMALLMLGMGFVGFRRFV